MEYGVNMVSLKSIGEKGLSPDDYKTGDVSDGYHTFDELYEHRYALFMALMAAHPDKAWYSMRHEDGSKIDGEFIAGIHLPSGDISYHLPLRLLDDVKKTSAEGKLLGDKWDGHTSEDVIKRLKESL